MLLKTAKAIFNKKKIVSHYNKYKIQSITKLQEITGEKLIFRFKLKLTLKNKNI